MSRGVRELVLFSNLCLWMFLAAAQPENHQHDHAMNLDRDGMVMNSNSTSLPKDCAKIAEEYDIEIRVGRRHARLGLSYGYTQHETKLAPCSRVNVTLVNDDQVRHQWMVHGLPRYLYPQGMFHLEVNGGKQKSGTFIVPSGHHTYLVHCDISKHMEQGLKAQLVVGRGEGDMPSIPGITGARLPDHYPRN